MTIELSVLSTVSYRGQEITAPRLRGLLALLAGEVRVGCGTGRLVEGLWPDKLPENPTKALQILISRARALLGPEVIASTPTGYRLTLGEERVDASAVLLHTAASAEKARAGDHAGSLAEAEAGLALWGADGPGQQEPLAGDPVSALRAERAAAYRALVRDRALGLARSGDRAGALPPLTGLARERPRDEEVLLELVRCEAAGTGAAAALATYDRYRRALREELGADPGPALRALHQELLRGQAPAVRRGVPHEPNALLGRDGDIAAVTRLLHTSRVTSIVGAGGLGKTRLAGAVGRRAEARAVHLVALAGVTGDADVAAEVASALGAGESRRPPAGGFGSPADQLTGIVTALGPGPVLLILDNCEHVVQGVAELVRALVSMTRELRVLTTSRAPLGLSSESVYPLPELDPATTVELFEQRARAARPGVELPGERVAELCRRLDGLPLATELAAARVRIMTVAEIAARLEDRFALLRGGARDAPQRHRTLHAVVDWSWNLLEPAGQAALRALSVFPGGFTAQAAERLLGGHELFAYPQPMTGGADVLQTLEELTDQSLLKVADTPSGTRFRMLETVREFSAAHREQAGETERVTEWFTGWARDFGRAHHDTPFGADPIGSWRLIKAEQDNLVAALRLGIARDDGAVVAAVTAVLAALWTSESSYARLSALTQDTGRLLSHHRPEPDGIEVLRTAASLISTNVFLGVGHGSPRFLVALRRLPAAPADTLVRAIATVLCTAPDVLGPDPSALHALCESGEPLLAGVASGVASYRWESEHEPDLAMKAARRTLAVFDERRIPWLQIMALSRLGELCLQTERGEEADRHIRRAMRLLDEFGEWHDTMGLRWGLVLANLQTGSVDVAERWLELALLNQPSESPDALTPDLAARAEIALARGDTERGLGLWREAVERVAEDTVPLFGAELDLEPWLLEIQAVAVAAHARHGRLDPVAELAAVLPDRLTALLTRAAGHPQRALVDFPVCGALALALGLTDLDHARRSGDSRSLRTGVRLIALADRFRWMRSFQPTMSSARARNAAEDADRGAYEESVAAYASLGPEGVREAALALLRKRG
ncbi:ATP-binding protein [Streptomyces katsurahamanus]|uniref:AfsR/SARP family transcriptional regulator n=1 Tax=Streptomyces katsurahamanus TaxID=2577098 RepID=A0ABW9NSD8_9ACTN|nr:BTAD domain-containing putative transcriptional regulator [Streptomyces katsurahamanus]MQS36160.1 AfsR/SARP family transcriptional regulator [Streptomyces katsurahamanus]